MEPVDAAVVFLVLGLGLSAAEIVAPGLVLLPFGLGAVVASLTGFVGADPVVQAIVFIVASLGIFLALRPVARRLNQSDQDEGIGARRLVGARATVLEAIPANDSGMVRIDREQWRAESIDDAAIPAGTSVTVAEVRGTRVLVTAESPGHSLPGSATPPPDGPPTRPPVDGGQQ
ncbi:MAG: NfeD family protein [Microthrixaceae bacterium]|nr:NfeD family protein [Microthrixaceae bacterium]